MIWEKPIIGKFVELRYAGIEDAQTILEIRQDPSLTKFLPRLDITVEQQREWLRKQHDREGDYYFVVWRKDGNPIGTIRVYNVANNDGETGSIAIKGTAFENLEAKLLCDTFAFETLGLKTTHNIVRADNKAIIKFVENFGVRWVESYIDEDGSEWLKGQNNSDRSKEYRKRVADSLYNNENIEDTIVDFEMLVDTENKIRDLLNSNIDGVDFSDGSSLVDNNILDSLGLVTVVSLLEDNFNCKIPFNKVNANNFNNVHNMAVLVRSILENNLLESNQAVNKDNDKLEFELLDLNEKDTEKTVVQRIFIHAADNPNEIAIIANSKNTTYHELAGMIFSICSWLKTMGVKKGDCVVVQAVHEDTCIACFYAVHLLGAILVPVEKNAAQARIFEIANSTKSKLIISCERFEESIEWVDFDLVKTIEHKEDLGSIKEVEFPDIEAPCEMIFTTGTTGKSKGVLMTHRHMSWYSYSVAKCIELKKGNRLLLTTPLNHAGGLRRTHLSLANGCCMVYLDGMSNLEKYFEYIRKYKVTSLYLPPVAIRILITRTGNELAKYKDQIDFVYSSSSPLPIGDCEKLCKLLPDTRLYNAYEASETPGVSAYNYNSEIKNNCMGKPNLGVECGILTDEGDITKQADIQGQICIKSKMNMKEYYLEENLTKLVFKDEWFVSNDLGFLDANGNIFYNGRKGDVINIGGYKIAPTDVEETALLSGLINECICIEDRDEYNVPYLKLLVVVENKTLFNVRELVQFMANKLEAYKIPRKIELTDSVKKTFNGKIDRKAYRL